MNELQRTENPSGLTWDNVKAMLRENAPHGCTAREVADRFAAAYVSARNLLLVMFEAGAVARVSLGDRAQMSTVLYFDA